MSKSLITSFFLESGNDLFVTERVHCKHPTLQEILDIDKKSNGLWSQELYDSYVSLFLTDPYDYMVFLDDKGIDYEKSSPFEVFCLKFIQYMENFSKFVEMYPEDSEEREEFEKSNLYYRAFKFFFDIDIPFYSYKFENGWHLFFANGEGFMDEEIYQYVYEFIRGINGISETPDKINPENEEYKLILIQDKREEEQRKKKKRESGTDDDEDDDANDRIGSRLSALLWIVNGNINPLDKFKLHIYDLIAGTNRFDKFVNYENTMIGAYTGHMDLKKVDLSKLHWAR